MVEITLFCKKNDIFGTQHYYISMPLMAIAHGNYKLAIKHNGKLYDTHKYINIF